MILISILWWSALFARAESPLLETPASSARPKEVCLIGSPLLTTYVDEFYKPQLNESDTFLKKYREHLFAKKMGATVQKALSLNPFSDSIPTLINLAQAQNLKTKEPKNYVKQNEVECALKRIPVIPGNRKICQTSDSDLLEPEDSQFYTQETPCITESIANYLQWGINEALSCFGAKLTEAERTIIFKKINLESSFGFFFQGINGSGIAQVIPKDIREVLKPGYSGHTFVKNYLNKNKTACQSFTELFKKDFLINSESQIPQCQFISIGDGIGRSYLAGVSLYLYFRSYHTLSAEYMLRYLGIPHSNENFYTQMRTILALGMYNKGPGTVWDSIQFHFEKDELAKKYKEKPSFAFNAFKEKLGTTSFYLYVTELERSFEKTFKPNGQCRFKNEPRTASRGRL